MFYGLKRWSSYERRPLSLVMPLSINKKKERTFLAEFKSGDEQAFSKIYDRFRKPILKFVRSRIHDDEVSNEITQEIFLKVYRFRENYQEEYAFSTWLWTIARNTICDHIRGHKGGTTYHEGMGEKEIAPDDLPSFQQHAEAILTRKDERRSLLKMMKSLTRFQKRVLWMRVIHQLSYSEISKKLGISLSAVKNLAHRAKQALADHPAISDF
jgi:RNA polymerase sigma-70 factor (ECF subfamily)